VRVVTALLVIRVLLAIVFALASVSKLADLSGSREAVVNFGVPDSLARPLGTLLPLVEMAVALALLPAPTARYGAICAFVLLLAFAAAIARAMARGEAPDCHCFGQLHSAPAGWRALVRNLVLAALAGVVVVAGWDDPGRGAFAWIGRLSASGAVALAAGVALAVLAAATAWALLALLRQNGRLLLRIDQLEARLDAGGAQPVMPDVPHRGLPLGQTAPPFTLSGLYGETVTLQALTSADAPVMLLFTDPRCGPCNALMPQIVEWQHEHSARLTVAVLTRGAVDDNRAKVREHGVASVWLDENLAVYTAYHVHATPGAVLIDSAGRIASPVVAGADAIAELVEQATRLTHPTQPAAMPVMPVPPRPPRPPRPLSPPVGTPAPELELEDLAGEPLALSIPDRDTLVIFWNPACGFCKRMLDDVRAYERSTPAGAPRLLLISTGSAAENLTMELTSPIALDQGFLAGAAFGANGTPSGILVGRDGMIASGLAVGAPGVMALASTASER
jgi:thiol-disulfide isomerase/thioredoxin